MFWDIIDPKFALMNFLANSDYEDVDSGIIGVSPSSALLWLPRPRGKNYSHSTGSVSPISVKEEFKCN